MTDFPLVYRWRLASWFGGKDSPLFGKHCRVVTRGSKNARLVEFEDGVRAIVSGNSLRRAER